MTSRILPRSESERVDALSGAWRKLGSLGVEERGLLRTATQQRLKRVLPRYRRAVRSRQGLLGQQTEATAAMEWLKAELRMYVGHFLQALQHAIDRGKGFRAGDRTYYGLHASQESLPRMRTVGEIVRTAADVVRGEAERIAAGGLPIQQPSAGEIEELLAQLEGEMRRRKQILLKLDQVGAAVIAMRDEVDELIRDVWDELDFAHRKEAASAKRRRLREWGVVFQTRSRRVEPREERSITVLVG
jgi:hypothetical protein